jgi:hypothetical protein
MAKTTDSLRVLSFHWPYSIVSASNGNITLAPNGTGQIQLNTANGSVTVGGGSFNFQTSSAVAGQFVVGGGISADSPSGITLYSGVNGINLLTVAGGEFNMNGNANGNIVIAPHGTGDVQLVADTVQVGDANAAATITTNGTGNLVLNTNAGTNSGNITITQGANADIVITPNGTGDVDLVADTVVIGDAAAAATLTTNGAGNLILNTNAGTNSGSITINQGANANIQIAPNGTGLTILQGPTVGIVTNTAGASPFTGRHTATSSGVLANLSMNVQKHRTDIALASMTSEPAVIGFSVRDSASTNRIFARLYATYQGTGTQPIWGLQTSTNGFTTSVQTAILGGGVGVWGATGNGYTHTTNGTGNLTLSTNNGTNSGTIVINQGANADIVITPNGTGDVDLVADTVVIGDANAGATLTTNGTGNLTLNTNQGTNSGNITIAQGANGNVDLQPNGTGTVRLIAQSVNIGDGTNIAKIFSSGSTDLELRTGGANLTQITLSAVTNGNIDLMPHGTGKVSMATNRFQITTAKTPASATDTGVAGDICWDADYIYVCTATNTWKRSAISTW